MKGTAIKNTLCEDSISSRFADSTFATTARADSLATIMLGAFRNLPWETINAPKVVDIPVQQLETSIEISANGFEFFVETINNPPAPNSNLARLLRSDSM